MRFFFLFLLLALGSIVSSSSLSSHNTDHRAHQKYFNVLDYGAVGDGVTVDNKAFENAWKATCSSNQASPTMLVPRKKTFLLQPIVFSGLCNSESVKVKIEGDLIAPGDPERWSCNLHGKNNCKQWIGFDRQNGLRVSGKGSLNGKGQQWWSRYCSNRRHCQKRPHSFTLTNSNRVQISNLTFIDSPQMHIAIKQSTWVNVTSLTIRAPGYSPNTDGIHLQDSQHISILNSHIGTGDDCVSMGDGTAYVRINSIICGPGHGISVGSLGMDGKTEKVNNIHVSNVEFRGSTNGVRIKTWQGGKGYAKDITFEKISLVGVGRPIVINQNYCDRRICRKQKSAVQINSITFKDIEGTSGYGDAITIQCSESHPCTNIIMERIKLRSPRNPRGKSSSSWRESSSGLHVTLGMRHHRVSPILRCVPGH